MRKVLVQDRTKKVDDDAKSCFHGVIMARCITSSTSASKVSLKQTASLLTYLQPQQNPDPSHFQIDLVLSSLPPRPCGTSPARSLSSADAVIGGSLANFVDVGRVVEMALAHTGIIYSHGIRNTTAFGTGCLLGTWHQRHRGNCRAHQSLNFRHSEARS